MRVEIRGLDGEGNDVLHGTLTLVGDHIVANPPDSPVLQKILSRSASSGEGSVPSDDSAAFLGNLYRTYSSAYFRATKPQRVEDGKAAPPWLVKMERRTDNMGRIYCVERGMGRIDCPREVLRPSTEPLPPRLGRDGGVGEYLGYGRGGEDEEPFDPENLSSTQFDLAEAGYPRNQGSPIQKLKELQAKISEEDLTDDGKEGNLHITVLYGIHTQQPEKVRSAVGEWLRGRWGKPGGSSIQVKLGAVSVFAAEESDTGRGGAGESDVVKVEVSGDALHDLHYFLEEKLANSNEFPEYQPHVTLAYVQPGAGQKYAGPGFGPAGHGLLLHRLKFMAGDGQVHEIDFWDDEFRSADEPEEAVALKEGQNEPDPDPLRPPVALKALDNLGGEIPPSKRLDAAKEYDFVTLPDGVEGAHCGNCFFKEKRGNGFICNFKDLYGLPITKRQVCDAWDSEGTLRAWEPGGQKEKRLDSQGGAEVPPDYLEAAKKHDFLTLPDGVDGTNCGTCSFAKEKGDGHVCTFEGLKGLPITPRNCCAKWTADGCYRAWEQEGEKQLDEGNVFGTPQPANRPWPPQEGPRDYEAYQAHTDPVTLDRDRKPAAMQSKSIVETQDRIGRRMCRKDQSRERVPCGKTAIPYAARKKPLVLRRPGTYEVKDETVTEELPKPQAPEKAPKQPQQTQPKRPKEPPAPKQPPVEAKKPKEPPPPGTSPVAATEPKEPPAVMKPEPSKPAVVQPPPKVREQAPATSTSETSAAVTSTSTTSQQTAPTAEETATTPTKKPQKVDTPKQKLEALRDEFARVAQEEYDAWQPDEEGIDEDVCAGGICDQVARRIAETIVGSYEDAEVIDGGQEGDDHAWTIVRIGDEYFGVDIAPGVYESGGGYNWQKIPDVQISPEDVDIWKLDYVPEGFEDEQPTAREQWMSGTGWVQEKAEEYRRQRAKELEAPSEAEIVYKHTSEERVAKAAKDFFGKESTPQDFASIVGAPKDAKVTVEVEGREASVAIKHKDYRAFRIITHDREGNLYVANMSIVVKESMRGQGLGSQIFGKQVANAVRLGAKYIQCTAVRGGGDNGYYTWPRLGYDFEFDADIIRRLPEQFKGATRISDLMKTPEGREYWRDSGVSSETRFDLSEDSLSRRILKEYLAEEWGIGTKAMPAEDEADKADDYERAPEVDDEILNRIWDRIAAEERETGEREVKSCPQCGGAVKQLEDFPGWRCAAPPCEWSLLQGGDGVVEKNGEVYSKAAPRQKQPGVPFQTETGRWYVVDPQTGHVKPTKAPKQGQAAAGQQQLAQAEQHQQEADVSSGPPQGVGKPAPVDPESGRRWGGAISRNLDAIQSNDILDYKFEPKEIATEQDWQRAYAKWGANHPHTPLSGQDVGTAARFITGLLNARIASRAHIESLMDLLGPGAARPAGASPDDPAKQGIGNPEAAKRARRYLDRYSPGNPFNAPVAALAAALYGKQAVALCEALAKTRAGGPAGPTPPQVAPGEEPPSRGAVQRAHGISGRQQGEPAAQESERALIDRAPAELKGRLERDPAFRERWLARQRQRQKARERAKRKEQMTPEERQAYEQRKAERLTALDRLRLERSERFWSKFAERERLRQIKKGAAPLEELLTHAPQPLSTPPTAWETPGDVQTSRDIAQVGETPSGGPRAGPKSDPGEPEVAPIQAEIQRAARHGAVRPAPLPVKPPAVKPGRSGATHDYDFAGFFSGGGGTGYSTSFAQQMSRRLRGVDTHNHAGILRAVGGPAGYYRYDRLPLREQAIYQAALNGKTSTDDLLKVLHLVAEAERRAHGDADYARAFVEQRFKRVLGLKSLLWEGKALPPIHHGHQPTAAVDFDGTLAEPIKADDPRHLAGPHKGPPPVDFMQPRKGAVAGMRRLKDAGWKVIIWTVRDDATAITMWLDKHGIPHDGINYNTDQPTNSPKMVADVYIDDRAVDPADWGRAVDRVLAARRPTGVKRDKALSDKPTPPRVQRGSYFARCERDESGHCLPEGQAGASTGAGFSGFDVTRYIGGSEGYPTELDQEQLPDDVEWLEETSSRAVNEYLNLDEVEVVDDWIGELARQIGPAIRERGRHNLPPDLQEQVSALEEAVDKVPALPDGRSIKVYRGLSLDKAAAEKLFGQMKDLLNSGDAYSLGAPTGTSTVPENAVLNYASRAVEHGRVPVVLQIEARSGLPLNQWHEQGQDDFSKEFLLSGTKRYRVVGIANTAYVYHGSEHQPEAVFPTIYLSEEDYNTSDENGPRQKGLPSFTGHRRLTLGLSKQPIRPAAGYVELRQRAEAARPHFEQLLASLGMPLVRLSEPTASKLKRKLPAKGQGGAVILVPPKGEERATEKVNRDYSGDWSRLFDMLRASVAVDSLEDLYAAIEALEKAGAQYARKPKDRFKAPLPSGYRDFLANYNLPGGVVAEVQFHLKPILIAREQEKPVYEKQRAGKKIHGNKGSRKLFAEAVRKAIGKKKAMSWLASGSGGDLVAPAETGRRREEGGLERRLKVRESPFASRLKRLSYRMKDEVGAATRPSTLPKAPTTQPPPKPPTRPKQEEVAQPQRHPTEPPRVTGGGQVSHASEPPKSSTSHEIQPRPQVPEPPKLTEPPGELATAQPTVPQSLQTTPVAVTTAVTQPGGRAAVPLTETGWESVSPKQTNPPSHEAPPPRPVPSLGKATWPTQVDVSLQSSQEDINASAKEIFGRDVTAEQLAGMAGAADGDAVILRRTFDGSIKVIVRRPGMEMTRKFKINPATGEKECENIEVSVDPEMQRGGMGTAMLVDQVNRLRAMGVSAITCVAAKINYGEGAQYVGYKVWPKLGYDSPLPVHVRARLPEQFAKAWTILDLYAMPGGPEWWAENGTTLPEARFSLANRSRSMKVLEMYLKKKKARQQGKALPDPEGRPRPNDPPITSEDEEILDEVWREIQERGWGDEGELE